MPIVLTGFTELLQTLSEIEDRVAKKQILAGAMKPALEVVRLDFVENAPDDPESWRRLKFGSGNIIKDHARKSVLNQTSLGVLGRVGDTPGGFPGYFVEWGTHHMGANPILQPSVDRTQDQFMTTLGEGLMLGILGYGIEAALDG